MYSKSSNSSDFQYYEELIQEGIQPYFYGSWLYSLKSSLREWLKNYVNRSKQ